MAKRGKITEFFDTVEGKKQLDAVKGYIDEYIAHLDKVKPVKNLFSEAQKPSDYVNGIKQMGELQAQQNKIVTEGVKATEKMILSQREIDKLYVEGRLAKQAYNKELKNEVLLQNSISGSIDEAKEKIKNLTIERNKLNLTTQEGIDQAKKFNQEIDKLNNFITENVAGLERRKINIGNYVESAQIVVGALGDVEKKLESLREKQAQLQNLSKTNPIGFKLGNAGDQLNQVNALLAKTEKEYQALNNITSDPKFLNIAGKVGDARTEVRGFTTTLIELEQKGLGGTDFATTLRKHLAELTDQVADTKEEIKAMSSDSRSFDQLSSSVNFLTNSYQTFVGIQALSGDQSEETTETIKKLVAVQSIANGLQEISQQLTQRGTIINKAYVFVQGLWKTATDASAASTVRLAAATKLLLGGLVIGGLVLLILKLKEYADAAGQLSLKQKTLNEVGRAAADNYGKEKAQLDLLITTIRTEGTTREEKFAALKKLQDNYPGYFDNLKTEKDLNEKLAEAYKRASEGILLKATAEAASDLLSQNASKKLTAQIDLQERIQKINAYERQFTEAELRVRGQKGLDEFRKRNQASRVFYAQEYSKLVEDIDKKNDLLITSIQDANNQIEKLGGKSTKTPKAETTKNENNEVEKNLKARFDLYKLQRERELEILNQTMEDEKVVGLERVAAAVSYIQIKQRLIQDEAEFEKKLGKKTADEIALIEGKASLDKVKVAEEISKKVNSWKKKETEAIVNGNVFQEVSYSHLYNTIQEKLKQIVDEQKKAAEIEKQLHAERKQRIQEIVQQLGQAAFEFATFGIEKQKNAIQEQIDMIDKRKEKEVEAVNQQILSEQDKTAKLQAIEIRSQVQKEQLALRQRKLDEQKAKIEKGAALFNIAITAAQDIFKIKAQAAVLAANPFTAALAPLALAQIPLVLISSAVAAALVAARPIPKYFKGRSKNDPYEGPALAGEVRPELMIRKDGSMELISEPTITNVKKGDVILPDAEKVFHAAMNNQTAAALSVKDRPTGNSMAVEKAIGKMEKSVVKAIQNIPQPNILVENPLRTWVKNGNSSQQFLK